MFSLLFSTVLRPCYYVMMDVQKVTVPRPCCSWRNVSAGQQGTRKEVQSNRAKCECTLIVRKCEAAVSLFIHRGHHNQQRRKVLAVALSTNSRLLLHYFSFLVYHICLTALLHWAFLFLMPFLWSVFSMEIHSLICNWLRICIFLMEWRMKWLFMGLLPLYKWFETN